MCLADLNEGLPYVRLGADSVDPEHRMRLVRGLELPCLLRRQRDTKAVDELLELLHLRDADDWCHYARPVQDPGERHVDWRHALPLCNFNHAIRDLVVGLRVIEPVAVGVVLLA